MTPEDIMGRVFVPVVAVALVAILRAALGYVAKKYPVLITSFELSGFMKLLIAVSVIALLLIYVKFI